MVVHFKLITRSLFLPALLVLASSFLVAAPKVVKIEPPNWWIGMKRNTLQLMVYGDDLGRVSVRSASPGLTVTKVRHVANARYLFVDVAISPQAHTGTYRLIFSDHGARSEFPFPLLKRAPTAGRFQGFDERDVVYLITPDRFANGDTTNDEFPAMLDGFHPDKLIGRHGGDLRGILGKLDYLQDLGVTALWINPLVENNTSISYHGYAVTDLYRIDPRFGTNELYQKFVTEAHNRSLKIILDHVSNHISSDHPWIKNLPTPDWLHGTVERHELTRHFKSSLPDIHSDSTLKVNTTRGWFNDYMPDLNQENPFVANYLIQNAIWWVESTGLDGIREDTYPYADQAFLADWNKALLSEYPSFSIVGEVWIHDPVFLAPYQRGSRLSKPFDTNLPSVTDFGLFDAFMKVFGDARAPIDVVYECLQKDFLYPSPNRLLTFLDNHDVARIMFVCKNDVQRFNLAMTLLLTTRGIPQLFYGDEIGMAGGRDHGEIRSDFPGGFPKSSHDAFTPEGRTKQENDIFGFVKYLLVIRKSHPALSVGTLMHIPPANNVYSYMRSTPDESILVIVNNGAQLQETDLTLFANRLEHVTGLRNLQTGMVFPLGANFRVSVPGNTASLFSLVF